MSVNMPAALHSLAGAEQIGKFDRSVVYQIYDNLTGCPFVLYRDCALTRTITSTANARLHSGCLPISDQIIPVLRGFSIGTGRGFAQPEVWQMVVISTTTGFVLWRCATSLKLSLCQ